VPSTWLSAASLTGFVAGNGNRRLAAGTGRAAPAFILQSGVEPVHDPQGVMQGLLIKKIAPDGSSIGTASPHRGHDNLKC